jgi:hypothetical protein
VTRALIQAYRAIAWRPHCRQPRHTILCRIARPFIGPECDFPAPE